MSARNYANVAKVNDQSDYIETAHQETITIDTLPGK